MMLPHCQPVLVGGTTGKGQILRALIAAPSNFNFVWEQQRIFLCSQRGVGVNDDLIRNFFRKAWWVLQCGVAGEAGRGCSVSKSSTATSSEPRVKFFLFRGWSMRVFIYYWHHLDFAETKFSCLPLFWVTKLLKCFLTPGVTFSVFIPFHQPEDGAVVLIASPPFHLQVKLVSQMLIHAK